ncbi:hypothetical protein Tco_0237600 [Tanacetum coccineum]
MSSDEASSKVTYTEVSSEFEELSDAGSPGVIVYGYDGLPIYLEDLYTTYRDQNLSSGYIVNSDPKEDPKDKSKDGPTDYQADGGNDDEDDDEEEEEHLALADSTAVASPPAYHTTARMSIRSQETMPFPSEAEIPSPPLPVSSPPTASPTYTAPLGYKAAEIRLRAASPLPLPPLPPPPSLLLPLFHHREEIPEADLPPRKRLCLIAPTPRLEVRESSTATAARHPGLGAARTTYYGFVDMVDDAPRRHVPREVGYGITDTWDELVDDLYAHLEDAQDSQAHLSERDDILLEDRQFHHQTVMLIENEARVSQEAWAHAMGCSATVHYELQAYRAHTQIHDLRISSQETSTTTLINKILSLQTQLIATLGRIDTLKAREPAHADDPEDVDSCT